MHKGGRMQTPVMEKQKVLTVRGSDGQTLSAPVELWMGILLSTLPPEWRDDVCTQVSKYLEKPQNQPKRIITP